MLLYHWTLEDRAEQIRCDGFRATTYWVGDGAVGVWVSEHPTAWKTGNDACLTLNVPDEVLRPEWKATGELEIRCVEDWQLPPEVATAHLIR